MIRLFHPLAADATPTALRLEGEGFHHLVRVLRAAVGDAIEVFDGGGRSFPARVEQLHADHAQLSLGPPAQTPPSRSVFIVQGVPKGERMEWVLQKGTELGATAFVPFIAERSVVQLKGEKADARATRWSRIVAEAARQCGRSDVPRVYPPDSLDAALAQLPSPVRCWVLDEEERTQGLRQAMNALPPLLPVAFIIGPEGGLGRAEVARAVALGASAVSLGSRVLRTETVAAAVLSVLSYCDGLLGG